MCNEIRNYVGCLNILVWICQQRQAERKFEGFASIYLILALGRNFMDESIISENIYASL